MFAPYCSTCARRVLLGTRRIVRFTRPGSDAIEIHLRCFCGTEVPADARAPGPARPPSRHGRAPLAAIS